MKTVITRTMHDWRSGQRITHLFLDHRGIRISECIDGAPLCAEIGINPRDPSRFLSLPFDMDHDDAVAYWSLTLLGEPHHLDAVRAYKADPSRAAA